MCGRYVLFTDEEEDNITELVHEIQRNLYGQPSGEPSEEADGKMLRINGEVFPTQLAPVLSGRGPGAMVWGLPMYKGSGVIINARAESVYEKSLYRQAMLTRRLIVPSHGFFEWRKAPGGATAKEKEKLRFNSTNGPGGRMLYMAGLYNEYSGGPRFAVITTSANEAMKPVHERMPVIVLPSEIDAFLRDAEAAREIITRTPPALAFVSA